MLLWLIGGGLPFAFFVGVFGGGSNPIVILVTIVLFGVPAVYTVYKQSRIDTEYNEYLQQWGPRFSTAKGKWNSLYYCHKCDGVFLPGHVPLVPTDHMTDYLFQNS